MPQAVRELVVAPPGPAVDPRQPGVDAPDADASLIEDELLVEEISIDGMFVVY